MKKDRRGGSQKVVMSLGSGDSNAPSADLSLGDVAPEGRVVRTLVLPAHLDLAGALYAKQDSTASIKLVDGVDA